MSAAARVQPQRVVIVDDTADLRELLRLALTRGGFDVVAEAGDGQEGIDVVRDLRPDVVLLDLAMPVMDGLEALPTMRRLLPTAKIIVLSGFGATQMSARAVAAGADGYVQKGASLNSILDYVRDVTSGVPRAPRPLSVVPPPPPADQEDSVEQTDPTSTATTAVAEHAPSRPSPTGGGSGGGSGSGHTIPHVRSDDRVESSPASIASRVSSWEALGMAPYGIIELADEPLFRIVYANAMAQRLLGHASTAGTPLGLASPALAALVSYHRLDSDASFEVELVGGNVRATLRRTGWSVLVYLDSTADDVGLLRRAIATTAHEIRGPVAVINGIAETLGWSAADMDEEQRNRLMASVARQARMLDSITADLLTAAQIQRGTLRIDMQPVDLSAVIEGVVTDRYDVKVVIEDERAVRADPLRLEQMLSNLLANAHKYGQAPYTVRVRPAGSRLSIDVVDEGEGVPPEFREHLFREYARANDTVAKGTGLGLYVVRTLAEAQSGSVTYTPGDPHGSTFTITLNAC
ncbi:signal transduction histidine kinase/DNA-binding NarL/FixJ family response regulator [Nocardioides ginsengisegetis]|uniref:histidine kinase n=1 Tax=Nocardioides ginsengisegetis TaxID=661491 RepID=A0A7W3J448_9ACTN|nr:response regulator [Nocardioides ginsengisegetis]MBA8805960.1 signal transduction histidine kinase/DNA-binding NarL/FixJ family response regulator [Nocardioides ginsengisegetis]